MLISTPCTPAGREGQLQSPMNTDHNRKMPPQNPSQKTAHGDAIPRDEPVFADGQQSPAHKPAQQGQQQPQKPAGGQPQSGQQG